MKADEIKAEVRIYFPLDCGLEITLLLTG